MCRNANNPGTIKEDDKNLYAYHQFTVHQMAVKFKQEVSIMFQSINGGSGTTEHFTLKSSLRLMALCGLLGSAALFSGCGGGGGSDSVAVVTPPGTTTPGTTTPGTTTPGTTTPAVDKYPNVVTPTVTKLTTDKTNMADRNYPYHSTDFDLKPFGFVEEEFLFAGKANAYDVGNAGIGVGSYYPGNAKVISANNPYKTRMFVIRPTDPAKFNGTVIVDWFNATSGYDIHLGWYHMKEMILRKGYAYVGISAQHIVVDGPLGMVKWNPNRYGTLDLTVGGTVGVATTPAYAPDALSFDVFAQGIKAVRSVPAVLGSLEAKKVITVGGSQSGGRLGVFMNNVNPLTGNIADGGLLLYGGPQVRTDLAVPIIKVYTETEALGTGTLNETSIAQPDTDKIKSWVLAGGAHADWHGFIPRMAIYLRDMGVNYGGASETCAVPSRNRTNGRYVYNSAIDKLEKYIANGTKMPTATPLEFAANSTPTAPVGVRDTDGIIKGGVRIPDVTVPTGVNVGTSCGLPGAYTPFDKAKMDSLYASHDDYVAKVTAAANKSVADGFMLAEDAQDAIDTAKASIWGRKLKCDLTTPLCADIGVPPFSVTSQVLRRHMASYILADRAQLLAPLDDANYQIATAYNVAAPDVAKLYFTQAVGSLEKFTDLLRMQELKGALSSEATNYLVGQTSQLIAALQKQ
jgi:hypothetical protein